MTTKHYLFMKKDNTAPWHSTRPRLMLVYLSIRLGSFPSKTQEVNLYHVNEFGNIHSLTTLLKKKKKHKWKHNKDNN